MAYVSETQKANLKTRIESELGTIGPTLGADKLDAVAEASADWIGTDILPTLVVTTTVAVTSVSGVTTGPGVSGPGAGTGTGTIS